VARIVKVNEIPELALEEANLNHVQESYLRQNTHARPITASKKRKSDVRATGAKWFRQKGTGRARQGELTNPHMTGGGLAFAPKPRTPRKRLNKHVRQSALRSAVLLHIGNGSAHVIQGKDFEGTLKTKEVAELLNKVSSFETINLVVMKDADVNKAARNIWNVRIVSPEFVNVRDLVESGHVVFSTNALAKFKELMAAQVVEPDEIEPVAEADEQAGGEE